MAKRFKSSENSDFGFNDPFSVLFRQHFDVLFNYGMRMLRDEEAVKDAIQDLFIKIWKKRIDFTTVHNPKLYLLKSLRNQIINDLELKQNSISKVEVEEYFSIEFSPEDYFIIGQEEGIVRERVVNALNTLSKKQKEVLYLRFFEGLEFVEIAQIMRINIQSVKNNIQRSYHPLREYFNKFMFFI